MASSSILYNLSDNFKMCQQSAEANQAGIQYPYYDFRYFSALVFNRLINLLESQGLILKFDLKINNFDVFQDDDKKTTIILDKFFDENQNAHQGFSYIYELHRFFYIDGVLISTFSLNYKFIYKQVSLFLQNVADYPPTQRNIHIGSWKVFLGGLIQQCDDCILKIDDQECLQCANSSDYLEEGKIYSCKSSCNFPFQILDQTKSCSFIPNQGLCNQITGSDRFFSDQCTCPKGQYLDKKQNTCLNCLQYCTSCQNAYSCEINNNFGYNGQCDINSFNNGIQCVSNFLKIINRLNKTFQINLNSIQCQINSKYPEEFYQIQDDALKLGHSSSSFFFSLNFNLQISNFQIDDVYSICYLKNQNQHIFSIISKVNNQKQLELQIIDSNQSILLKANIEAQTNIWIGFYYDYLGINLLVKYINEQNSLYSSDIKNIIKFNLENPILVFGIQSPLYLNKFPLCGNIGTNNWIIKGDLSMRSFMNNLFIFSEDDLISIAIFNFLNYKENFEKNHSFIVNKIDPLINLTVQPFSLSGNFQFDQLKGFQFKSNGGIVNLNKKLNQVPFVIKLSITANDFYPCVQYYYKVFSLVSQNNQIFSVGLKSNYLDYQYYLEICSSDGNCKNSNTAKFNYLDPNILIIKVKYLKYSDQLTVVRFSILLNYIQDEFDLEIPQQLFVNPPQFYDILIGGTYQQKRDPIIFYSILEVYTGGFYYVDYDNQDPCFVYINRQKMTCILPKQGYALNKDGVVVQATDCNLNIQQNMPLYFFNKYTMMCQNSGIILPYCRNLNISDLTCIECIDSQMDLSKNCSCPDGMYLNKPLLTCKKCSVICKTCSDQNKCLECKGQNLIPPLCNCFQLNYYLDANLNCQKCSLQCNSCTQNQSYCLTCSQGRVNPPQCYCNPDLYQNSISDSITNPCLPKNCPFKCLVCDPNNQCVQCRGDRIFPPYCVCSQNYYDDSTKVFYNRQYGYVLHPVYSYQPYQFNIGPYFLENTKTNFLGDIPTNRQIDSIISQFQILFYILNSIQPTSMFILLNIQIPSNLYQFLQQFAKRVYRNVPEKQFDIIQNQYNLFWFELNDEVSSAKLKAILDILIKRISIENEVNLLMLTLSICIQFQEVDSSKYFQRWSFYTATFMTIFFLYSNYWYYSTYNSEYFEKNKNKLELFYLSLQREKYPENICILSCILNILTAFLTGYLRPFQYLCISVIKVIGDILLSTTWILMILIINFNQKISSNVVLDSRDVNYYLILGYSASIVLTAFNGIFFIKLILETVIIPIFEKIQANQQKKQIEQIIYA
ncbi:hypothetical protein ABPG74_006570 [Tetrahymena malaccensis]